MLKYAGVTDKGARRRTNQDAILMDVTLDLFVVADGMGGHRGGQTASHLAVEEIHDFLDRKLKPPEGGVRTNRSTETMERFLSYAIQSANKRILEKASQDPELNEMGTTAAALLLLNGSALVAHVGDSRVYRIRGGGIERLTKDHSRVQELIDREFLDEETATSYPMRNIITRALGGEAGTEVDTSCHPMKPGDQFLLCSDGLCGFMPDAKILEGIQEQPDDPESICRRLLEQILSLGAPDNVSIILVRPDVAERNRRAAGRGRGLLGLLRRFGLGSGGENE